MFETEMLLSYASKPDEDKKIDANLCSDDFETWYKNHKFKKELKNEITQSNVGCMSCLKRINYL
jgi:hypothetical protein